jgi:pseudaminic acid cytidylyltransferase
MMRIAVIPARGGSKRIPRKNIRPFAGRPILAWPIESALRSGVFTHVLVSTDDPEIAALARAQGAEAPFLRPAELADDYSSTTAVIAHAQRWCAAQGWRVQATCCIYPTAVSTQPDDLIAGLELLESGPWSYAFAATRHESSAYRSFTQSLGGGVEMLFPQHYLSRSQDLPITLRDAAQFYWGSPESWSSCTPVFGPRSVPLVLPWWKAVDIDDEDDWARAELIHNWARASGRIR